MTEARFVLKRAGCIPYELTEEEYEEFIKILTLRREKTKELKKVLIALFDTFGAEKAVEIVHTELNKLMSTNA